MNHSMMLSARHQLFRRGFAAISAIGADRWLRPYTRGSGMILMFHHVRPWQGKAFSPNAALEITPEFLVLTIETLRREGIDIISIDDISKRLKDNEGERPFAVLTFDDGYRDNIEYAAPLLQALDVPWTLYVVNEFASGRGDLWWLNLERIIAATEELSILIDDTQQRYQTLSLKQKYTAFDILQRRLKAMPRDQYLRAVNEMNDRFNIEPDHLVSQLCANWEELKSLAENPNVTIGAHTLTHPILAQCNARDAESEIAGSKDAIEKNMGRPIRHFSFPHGDPNSAGAREFRLSRESGYDTAVTTQAGHIFASSKIDLWSLPRVSINGLHQSESALRALFSGAAFLPQALMQRNGT